MSSFSTFEEIAIAIVILALCNLILAVVHTLAARMFFAHIQNPRRKKMLTRLAVAITGLVLLTVVVSGALLAFYRDADARTRSFAVIVFVMIMLLVIAVLVSVTYRLASQREPLFTTKNITRMAVFTALSVVLYQFVKFPLPFIFPSFLDIQFSEMPALLGGFMIGPEAGAIIVILKIFIKLPFTSTGGVGELGDLILGLVFVLSSSILYRILRTKEGALISLITGSVLCIMTAILINRYLLIPFYTTYMFPWEALLGMVSGLYPGITKATFYHSYLWLAVLPFNTLRCLVVVLVTFFMYKPTKRIFGFVEKKTRRKSAKVE